MFLEIFKELAKGRPDLLGPLVYGWVASDLFAWSIGLECASSLSKKIAENPDAYPTRYEREGGRRLFFRLEDLEVWSTTALKPLLVGGRNLKLSVDASLSSGRKKTGRPRIAEQKEAKRRGLSVAELRQLICQGGV